MAATQRSRTWAAEVLAPRPPTSPSCSAVPERKCHAMDLKAFPSQGQTSEQPERPSLVPTVLSSRRPDLDMLRDLGSNGAPGSATPSGGFKAARTFAAYAAAPHSPQEPGPALPQDPPAPSSSHPASLATFLLQVSPKEAGEREIQGNAVTRPPSDRLKEMVG